MEKYQEIVDAVRETIERTVNGKIDKIDQKLDAHMLDEKEWRGEVTVKLDDLKPVSEGLVLLDTLKRFLVWLGVPILVAGAWLIAKIKGL